MEGRDIGTVVFPDAQSQNFSRRFGGGASRAAAPGTFAEGRSAGIRSACSRKCTSATGGPRTPVSPLVRAHDAVLVDNTAMDVEETARLIVLLARNVERLRANL